MNLRGSMSGIVAIFLLIVLFTGFIMLLTYQKNNNEGKSISLSMKDADFTLEDTKAQVTHGIKLFLIVGGILTILGIIYLIIWIIKQYLNTR